MCWSTFNKARFVDHTIVSSKQQFTNLQCFDQTTIFYSHLQKDNIFVKCIWRNDKKKFEPFEVADVKLPSLIDDIKKKMIEIEIDNTDDED